MNPKYHNLVRLFSNVQGRDKCHDRNAQLTKNIEQWSMIRDLDTADPNKQILKLDKKLEEHCKAIANGRQIDTVDAIGDMCVVLTILSRKEKYRVL